MLLLMISGFCVRFVQSLGQAAPFILTGFFVAAVFRCFLGTSGTARLFGQGGSTGLLRAWALGMLLPVCSLGVLPIVLEMRRAGLKGGTILAFAMSAPLFNPLSLLYGLTLSEPVAILSFAGCSLVIVTIVGIIWDRIFPDTASAPVEAPPLPHGLRRLAGLFTFTFRQLGGPAVVYVVIGLAGVGVLGAIIPHASLQPTFNHDRPEAPLTMAALGVPVYATPMLAMSQMGMMFQHANSIGAAFVLLALGAGMNLGLVAWMWKEFQWKRSLTWLVLLLIVVVGLGFGVEKPLFPKDVEPANHTHAFDIYGQPFAESGTPSAMLDRSTALVKRSIKPFEWISLKALLVGLLVGIVLVLSDRRNRLMDWAATQPPQTEQSGFDIVVPPWALAAVSLVGLVVLSVVGCYAYYPPKSEIFEEIRVAKTEALSGSLSGEVSHAEYWIDVYQEWTRKLEVSTYLRTGSVSDYQKWKARLVREHLEMLKHSVEDGEKEEARAWVSKIQRSHRRMRAAFRSDEQA